MKGRSLTCVVASIITALALIPPVRMTDIPIMVNSSLWIYLILCLGGFLGFAFTFTSANKWLKVMAIVTFISCFFTSAPYLSFSAYVLFIAALYFFLMCKKISWSRDIIFNVVQSVFFLNLLLFIMQLFGKDSLLNFGLDTPVMTGTIGNSMMFGSFVACLTPLLVIKNKLYIIPIIIASIIIGSVGLILALSIGTATYLVIMQRKRISTYIILALLVGGITTAAIQGDSYKHFFSGGRYQIWKRTITLAKKRPLFGYGIGTYRLVFPALSSDVAGGITNKWKFDGTEGDWIRWYRAHSFPMQLIFEMGVAGVIVFGGFLIWLLNLFFKSGKSELTVRYFACAMILIADLAVHFPDRMIQAVPIIICFVAFYITRMKGDGISDV